MRIEKESVDVKLEIPGAVIRQQIDFGNARGLEKISAEYFTLSAGVDTAPIFEGLKGNHCHSPHWGFVLSGCLTVTDANGATETVKTHDLFYWPPGHNVRVEADSEVIMFSPQHEHTEVIDHMITKLRK